MLFDAVDDHLHHVLFLEEINQAELDRRWAWCKTECASTFNVVWLVFRNGERRLAFAFAHRADAKNFDRQWEITRN